MRRRRAHSALTALAFLLAIASPVAAQTVGSDLEALDPTKTVVCQGASCDVAQALSGNGTPFSPPTGVISSWSVKLGVRAPEGLRLVVQDSTGTAGPGQGRRTIDVGTRQTPRPNGVSVFPERLPIHADEVFGVRLEGSDGGPARATIAAPFEDEYKTMLLWDPLLPFGGAHRLADRVFQDTRIALSIEVVPPAPGRCEPLNLFTGSQQADDYGGFQRAGDVIYGRGGADSLRGYSGSDCIYGGRGGDRIAGMDGADRIEVRDGQRDTVGCGDGRDFVKADRLDRLSGCERVRRG